MKTLKELKRNAHPVIQENLKYFWVCLLAVILIEGLTFAIQYFEGISFHLDLYNSLISLSIIVIPMVAVNTVYLSKQLFIANCKTDLQKLSVKTLSMYVGIIIATIAFELIYNMLGFEDDDYIVLGSVQFSPSTSEVISNIFYATVIGIPVFLRQQVKMNAEKEIALQGEQLERAKHLNTKAHLDALQAKVNPHFLYNSLNSIASLVHESPDIAEDMILSLSELFRYTLNNESNQYSTINQEVNMVQTYMNIELVRFQRQLSFKIDVDEEIRQKMIPRLLLQPLVENAIKHGTSKVKRGKIEVKIYKESNEIVFLIIDNGPSFPEIFSFGYGLKSVTSQLSLLYPDTHEFKMINEPDKHIRITIPVNHHMA